MDNFLSQMVQVWSAVPTSRVWLADKRTRGKTMPVRLPFWLRDEFPELSGERLPPNIEYSLTERHVNSTRDLGVRALFVVVDYLLLCGFIVADNETVQVILAAAFIGATYLYSIIRKVYVRDDVMQPCNFTRLVRQGGGVTGLSARDLLLMEWLSNRSRTKRGPILNLLLLLGGIAVVICIALRLRVSLGETLGLVCLIGSATWLVVRYLAGFSCIWAALLIIRELSVEAPLARGTAVSRMATRMYLLPLIGAIVLVSGLGLMLFSAIDSTIPMFFSALVLALLGWTRFVVIGRKAVVYTIREKLKEIEAFMSGR